jgi:hypothetical protein
MAKGKKIGDKLVLIGVDGLKNIIFDRLLRARGIRFSNSREQNYFEQLASERRVILYRMGRPVRRFERTGRTRNEALDCMAYAFSARQAVHVSFDRREAELRGQPIARRSGRRTARACARRSRLRDAEAERAGKHHRTEAMSGNIFLYGGLVGPMTLKARRRFESDYPFVIKVNDIPGALTPDELGKLARAATGIISALTRPPATASGRRPVAAITPSRVTATRWSRSSLELRPRTTRTCSISGSATMW